MTIGKIYNDFFINLVGFLDDIKNIPIHIAILKEDRMLYFGFFLIFIAIVMVPLYK